MKIRIVEGLLHLSAIIIVAVLVAIFACTPGCAADGRSCTVEDSPDGFIVTCTDGTEAVLKDGANGEPGAPGEDGKSCTVAKDDSGVVILSCEDGSAALVTTLTGEKGDTGEPGSPGLNALIVSTEEGVGANCSYGGTRIDVGVDLNSDGFLSEDEVTNTTYVCNATGVETGILYGDFEVRNSRDFQAVSHYERITGRLDINAGAGDMEFSNLTHAGKVNIYGGDVSVQSHLAFPVLVEAKEVKMLGGDNGTGVVSFSAPVLETVSEVFFNGPSLQSLDIGSIRVLDRLEFNHLGISAFDLHSLEEVGMVIVRSNPNLPCSETAWLCDITPDGACTVEEFDGQDYVSCF
jgi:hypothetical protein